MGDAGSVGLITYMRTDSTRISAPGAGRGSHVHRRALRRSIPAGEARRSTRAAKAQEAHEAIRPTSVLLEPAQIASISPGISSLLYTLIWNRFVASQMRPALFDTTSVEISAGDYLFRVKGSVPKFAGWTAVYGAARVWRTGSGPAETEEEARRALLGARRRRPVEPKVLRPEQKFTQPPPRFTEATLVKELEENGIGRPSIICVRSSATLQDRITW